MRVECEGCGHVFDEAGMGTTRQKVSNDPPMWEPLACCPKCGDTDMHDYEECEDDER